jgi:hypothetical protein
MAHTLVVSGKATLVNGQVTVTQAAVATGDYIVLTTETLIGATFGPMVLVAHQADIVNGTSFVIKALSPDNGGAVDTTCNSVVTYIITRES